VRVWGGKKTQQKSRWRSWSWFSLGFFFLFITKNGPVWGHFLDPVLPAVPALLDDHDFVAAMVPAAMPAMVAMLGASAL